MDSFKNSLFYEYYIEYLKKYPLEFTFDEKKGYGLKANKAIQKGELILVEKPFISEQIIGHSVSPKVCSFCRRFLGTLQEQMTILCKEENKSFELPAISNEDSVLSEKIPCKNNCGVVYCGNDCRDADWMHSHDLLCVSANLETKASKALKQFKEHAISTHNLRVFNLAIRVVSFLMRALETRKETTLSALLDSFLSSFFHKTWWETIVHEKEDPNIKKSLETEIGDSLKWMKTFFFESISEKREEKVGKKLIEELEKSLSLETYSKFIGLFNLNNISIEILSPLRDYFISIDSLPKKFKSSAVKKLVPIVSKIIEIRSQKQKKEESMEDGKSEENKVQWRDESSSDSDSDEEQEGHNSASFSWEIQSIRKESKASRRIPSSNKGIRFSSKIFSSFKGTGLYPLICKINHSCVPSLTIEYINGDATAFVIANRDIKEGEEVTISYIDEELPFEDRQHELCEYLFICICEKCSQKI